MKRDYRLLIDRLLDREQGTIYKVDAPVHVVLVYPNSYWVGMSNLGFQTIYYQLNRREDTLCQRSFYFTEFAYSPPVSLEGSRDWHTFNIIGFSISFELDCLNMAQMLNQARIPLSRRERQQGDFPLIIAGGAMTYFNFRPLINIVDIIIAGDAEESIHEVMDILVSLFSKQKTAKAASEHRTVWRDRPHPEKISEVLTQLSRLKGVYVPGFSPEKEAQRPIIRKTTCLENYQTVTRVLSKNTEFKNTFLIEISRGCNRRCYFCMTGYMMAPWRLRSRGNIMESAREGLKLTRRIGLVSAAVSDYPGIEILCSDLIRAGASISVSSLRADSVTPGLIKYLAASGQKTITIAPEAGTETLRQAINKKTSEDKIMDVASQAKNLGIERLKLYFMIGLPGETGSDLKAIVRLTAKISSLIPVTVSVSAFVPKPGTPFFSAGMEAKTVLKAKFRYLKSQLSAIKDVSTGFESLRSSLLAARISAGDEDVLFQI